MRVLATGSRKWTDKDIIRRMMDTLPPRSILAHGGASGADTLTGEVTKELGWEVVVYHADWHKYGKAAGPIRNQYMLEDFQPDLVLAFPLPNSKGTRDMIERAIKAGLYVVINESSAGLSRKPRQGQHPRG